MSDFRVEEEKLADKILCLFGEKQIESTLKKPRKNSKNKSKAVNPAVATVFLVWKNKSCYTLIVSMACL